MTNTPRLCIVCGATPVEGEINDIAIWRCEQCGLMWQRSLQTSLEHYEHAEGNFSPEKEKLQRRNIRDRIRTIRRYMNLDATCDIGGSKGYFVEEALAKGYRGVYGIDPNEIQVRAAKERGVNMVLGSSKDAPRIFSERDTRNAALFHVIEHLVNPEETIGELRDALPVGGHLVVETPNFDAYSFHATNYHHKLVYDEHVFYFNHKNLQQFLERVGFSIVAASKRDFDPFHLPAQEALFRLGLLARGNTRTLYERALIKCASHLRTPLSLLVRVVGRQDFSLVIAKKR